MFTLTKHGVWSNWRSLFVTFSPSVFLFMCLCVCPSVLLCPPSVRLYSFLSVSLFSLLFFCVWWLFTSKQCGRRVIGVIVIVTELLLHAATRLVPASLDRSVITLYCRRPLYVFFSEMRVPHPRFSCMPWTRSDIQAENEILWPKATTWKHYRRPFGYTAYDIIEQLYFISKR